MNGKNINQIKLGAFLSYLQTGMNAVITLLYTPIMIRLLGRSEFGLYNTVTSVISMIALLNLGFSSTYIRFYSQYDASKDKLAVQKLNGMFLCIFSGVALIASFCGFYLANHLTVVFSNGLTAAEYATARKLMLILTGNLAVTLVTNTFACIITANERFVLLKLVSLLRLVVSPLVTIPLMLAGYGSVGVVIVTAAFSCVTEIIYICYVLLVLRARFSFGKFDPEVFRAVWKFTMLVAIHLIVDQINWNVDKILLGRFKGTASVALYTVGFSQYTHYMAIGLTMCGIFTPRVHKIINQFRNDGQHLTQELTGLFSMLGRIQFAVLAPIAVGFILWGKPFLDFWAGPEYTEAYYIALLLMLPGSIDIIQNIGIEIQRALDLHGFRAGIYAAMAAVNIVISVLLCQKYGAIGCAVGTAISLLLVQGLIINIYYHKKCYINIVFFWKQILNMGKSLIPPICFGVVVNSIKSGYSILELLLCLIAFVLIYVVSLYCLGLNGGEKQKIKIILRKAKIIKRK